MTNESNGWPGNPDFDSVGALRSTRRSRDRRETSSAMLSRNGDRAHRVCLHAVTPGTAAARWSKQRAERGADGSQTTFSLSTLPLREWSARSPGCAGRSLARDTAPARSCAPRGPRQRLPRPASSWSPKNRHGMSGTVPLTWTPPTAPLSRWTATGDGRLTLSAFYQAEVRPRLTLEAVYADAPWSSTRGPSWEIALRQAGPEHVERLATATVARLQFWLTSTEPAGRLSWCPTLPCRWRHAIPRPYSSGTASPLQGTAATSDPSEMIRPRRLTRSAWCAQQL